MFGSLDISASGMIAQRMRMDVLSANIANANTVLNESGQVDPYRRRIPLMAPGNPSAGSAQGRSFGVHLAEVALDQAPPAVREFDPNSPLAYTSGPFKGYVAATNINTTFEQINEMEAMRAYEANLAAAEATKQMAQAALRLLA